MKVKFGLLAVLVFVTAGIVVAGSRVTAAPLVADTHPAQVSTSSVQSTTPVQTTGTTPAPRKVTPTPTKKPARTVTRTPTPAPTATDTPTPAPTWHTIGTYSGNTEKFLVTLHDVQGPVRITWTCQVTASDPQWALGFMFDTANDLSGGGSGTMCQSGNTSGVMTFSHGYGLGSYGIDYNLWSHAASGQGMGNWTAIVQIGY